MEEKETNRLKTKSFEDLLAWQKAHKFVLSIYLINKNYPKDEIFGITSQLKKLLFQLWQISLKVTKNTIKKKKYIFLISHKVLWKNADII